MEIEATCGSGAGGETAAGLEICRNAFGKGLTEFSNSRDALAGAGPGRGIIGDYGFLITRVACANFRSEKTGFLGFGKRRVFDLECGICYFASDG